ncbi:MAG: prepilin peptidase [Bacillota bacterium]|nr:MAG: prepilin peptidase [Bacillota bacterium]
MFPVDLPAVVVMAALAAAGAAWDIRTGRIPNGLTVPALAVGLLYAARHDALLSSLVGTFLVGGIYAVLFALGGMGGGDVKFGAALGAWGGFPFSVVMFTLAALAGGVQALWTLRHPVLSASLAVLSGQGLDGAHEVFRSAYQPKQTVPYGVAIGAGAIGALLWPVMPGVVGAWGREVYALLAAIVG